jgi:CRISPR-associated protein Cas8b/Csh1 subtype I-B
MEWLQTQRIGKALLESGSKIEDAYYQKYIAKTNRDGQPLTPCIINIRINTTNGSLEVERFAFDNAKSIPLYNFFTSIAGNFTSYYLCNSYLKCGSILDFLGIDKGVISDEKNKKLIGLKKVLAEMDKSRASQHSKSELIILRDKIRENEGLCKKIDLLIKDIGFVVEQSKKIEKWNNLELFSKEERENFRKFTKLNFFPKDLKKSTDEVVFVTITADSKRVSQLDAYKNFCLDRFLDLAKIDLKKAKHVKDSFGSSSPSFEVSFPRDNINLLKSSTGSPTTLPNLLGTGFILSKQSYNELKLGAKKIDNELKIRIAGMSHYIIPEFTGAVDIQYVQKFLKDSLNNELVFSEDEYEKTEQDLLLNTNNQINAILLLGYVKGKGDIDFVNSIRIPTITYFERLRREFDKARNFKDEAVKLSFQSMFYLFPMASDKSRKPDALFFYKSIFEHTPYEKAMLLNIYANLIHLYRYGRPYDKEGRKLYGGTINISYSEKSDYSTKITSATLKFQVLLNLLNNLFQENTLSPMDYSTLPPKTQKVFERCNYQEDKAALFYLGKLIRLAADAQAKKQKNKRRPILDKINYGGMKLMDLKWLFSETIEKLKQYEVINYAHDYRDKDKKVVSGDLTMFKLFFDSAEQSWSLSDIENVFYIFSGYALYWEVLEKDIPKPLLELVDLEVQEEEAPNQDDNTKDESEDGDQE